MIIYVLEFNSLELCSVVEYFDFLKNMKYSQNSYRYLSVVG